MRQTKHFAVRVIYQPYLYKILLLCLVWNMYILAVRVKGSYKLVHKYCYYTATNFTWATLDCYIGR